MAPFSPVKHNVAPEYGKTWQATTRGDVYSYGVLTMELSTGRRAVDEGEECLVEWAGNMTAKGRPNMKEVLDMFVKISGRRRLIPWLRRSRMR
ncbi:unnamed protein product [Microthlaspi erraticum]|uniref:Serine-threonine/tyrosine-protein kinase catalytic domain-containing protein n=1 Tax=Microthlaspi erraticum TaxID=1685480 RepID=A0A6D2HXC8_9BRAS|nr:unnamed protein product [Microthlaspi erraticum]